jgi:hypothetical protein
MKKSVILFLLVFLVGSVSGWGPLTHNAITKSAGKTSTGYLMGATGPDISYALGLSDMFHDNNKYPTDKSFSKALYNAATNTNQKDFAYGWLGHNAADSKCWAYGFKTDMLNSLAKLHIDVLSYTLHNGRNYVDVYPDQIAKAYKNLTGKSLSTVNINSAEYILQTGAAAEVISAMTPGQYNISLTYVRLIHNGKGYYNYTNGYAASVTAYSSLSF